MARESTEFRQIEKRMNATRKWLRDNSSACFTEQKHLDEGSQERAYWHYGYMVALRDVMRFLAQDPETNTHSADITGTPPPA